MIFEVLCSFSKKHEAVTVGNKTIISHVIAWNRLHIARDYSPPFGHLVG